MIVCGTGHRPNKLGGYGQPAFNKLVSLAEDWICNELTAGDIIISGMALGWDQALAQAAVSCSVPFYAYMPFIKQESKWPRSSQEYFHKLLSAAAKVVICSEGEYAAWKMQVRNARMVDDSDLVLALWNGTEGGTANCVKYAKKQNKQIVNLWDTYNNNKE